MTETIAPAGHDLRLGVRRAASPGDLERVGALRARLFRKAGQCDADRFDAGAEHLMVEDRRDGRLIAACRLWTHRSLGAAAAGYAGRFYDLAPLDKLGGPMVEIGRLGALPGPDAPEALRLLWAAMTDRALRSGCTIVFGCASLEGTHPARHAATLGRLAEVHLAPPVWRPGRGRGGEPVDLLRFRRARPRRGERAPALLRSYLALGGRTSDHAVIDRDLETLHVFVGVPVAGIPPGRARSLRAAAAALGLAD